jgi:hypothetical protein
LEYWKHPGFLEALNQATSASVAAPTVTNQQPDFILDEQYHEQSKVPLPVLTKKRKSKDDIASTKPTKKRKSLYTTPTNKKKAADSLSKTTKKRDPFTGVTINSGEVYALEKYIHFETVPSFSDVKLPLEKAGCVFLANLYCRPGKGPRTDGSFRKGHDYFFNEDDFRKYICAHGLAKRGRSCKGRKDMLDELEKAKLDI